MILIGVLLPATMIAVWLVLLRGVNGGFGGAFVTAYYYLYDAINYKGNMEALKKVLSEVDDIFFCQNIDLQLYSQFWFLGFPIASS